MFRKILLLIVYLQVFSVLNVGAASHGHGRVSMKGSIIDSACAISTDESDQTISMGSIPISQLLNEGHGVEVPFQIHLINCTLHSDSTPNSRWKGVNISFFGQISGDHWFAMQGSASGEALAIEDSEGELIVPTKQLPDVDLTSGDMVLKYRMRVEANHNTLHPGSFHTVIKYFMEYD